MEKGYFKEDAIRTYLGKYHERFWLFHGQYPFWQIPEAAVGTEYTAAKLNGELSESGNKVRLFPLCSGIRKQEMEYGSSSQVALYVNAMMILSKAKRKRPSVSRSWMAGKAGIDAAVGDNLFQTLMLNLTF